MKRSEGSFLTTLPDWLGSTCCGATDPADLAHLSETPQQAREGSEPPVPTRLMCSQESLETPLGDGESGCDGDRFRSTGRSQLEKRIESYLLPAPSLL